MRDAGDGIPDARGDQWKESRRMKKSDQIIYLHLMGLRPSHISRRLATSEQWISQLLARPPAKRPRLPVVADLPEQRGRRVPESERRRALSEEQLNQCRTTLKKSPSWTWLEADVKLKEENLEPPAGDITKLLRQAGFNYDRSKKRWFRQKK